MNCRTARKQIHAQLDGTLADRAPLQAHLDGCAACRRMMDELQRISVAAAGCANPGGEEARLERLTGDVLCAIETRSRCGVPARALWAPVAGLAGLLLAFALGYNLAPRPIATTQKAAAPQVIVRERVVTREVPVYKDRVVYRDRVVTKVVHVPRVRTRVVTRAVPAPVAYAQVPDRGAEETPATTGVGAEARAEAPPTPASVAEEQTELIVQTLPAPEPLPAASYSRSTRLARLITDATGE
jgi:hypothetical protein